MKLYALHTRTTITGGSRAGILEAILEPVFFSDASKAKPTSFQQSNNEKYSYNTLIRTNYYKTKEDAMHSCNCKITDLEEIINTTLDNLPFTRKDICNFMRLHQCSYSIAVLRLLCVKYPNLIIEYFENKRHFAFLWASNVNRNYSYFDLASNKNKFFKYVAEKLKISFEVFILPDEDFYNQKSNLKSLMMTYAMVYGNEVEAKFENIIDEKEKSYLFKRYIAINCVVLSNGTTLSAIAKTNGLTRQMISKYQLDPNVSKAFKEKVNSLLCNIDPSVEEFL